MIFEDVVTLDEKEWGEFIIDEVFDVENSKPYHKVDLSETGEVPYITRTAKNNGLETIVNRQNTINPKDVITFGAESVVFFYQPYEHITGNKVYYVKMKGNSYLLKKIGLFLTCCFQNNFKNTDYGFGLGLTGTRFRRMKVKLPINSTNIPDWEYMEQYTKNIISKKLDLYLNYIEKLKLERERERE